MLFKQRGSQILAILEKNRPKLRSLKQHYFGTQILQKIIKLQYSEKILKTLWNCSSNGTYFFTVYFLLAQRGFLRVVLPHGKTTIFDPRKLLIFIVERSRCGSRLCSKAFWIRAKKVSFVIRLFKGSFTLWKNRYL